MARTRTPSRASRWADAVSAGQAALAEIEDAQANLATALGDLTDLQAEYEDWQGNLPDSLTSSPVADKLQAVVDLDIPDDADDLDAARSALDEAEQADLPLGWGKD